MKIIRFFAIVSVFGMASVTVQANTWKGGTGNWSSFNWDGGEPTASNDAIVWNGTVQVTESGETCKSLQLAGGAGNFRGYLEISAGSLEVVNGIIAGPVGAGKITMTGGHLKAKQIELSRDRYNPSSIEISGDADLQCQYLEVGWPGIGYVTQNGGTITAGELALTNVNDKVFKGEGYYTMNAGTLNAGAVYVGIYKGEFKVTNPGVNVYISDMLDLRPNGNIDFPSGTFFHMNDNAIPPTRSGSLRINKTDPTGAEDLVNLTLNYDGTVPASTGQIEAAGRDLGDRAEGFQNNFVLGGLYLGPNARVSLVNQVKNQPSWNGTEALYVKHIRLAQGAVLNCNCIHLYYETIENTGGTINKGVDCDKLEVWANPEEIASDGVSQSQISAQLVLSRISAPDKMITLTTDKGHFLDPQTQLPTTTVSAVTNAQGMVQIAFVASNESGMAFIDAEYSPAALKDTCSVSMVQYDLHIVADQAWYMQVPGRDSNNPTIRDFASDAIPQATLFGLTDIPIVLELSGVGTNGKILELGSETKEWIINNELHGSILFPDQVATDAQGKAYLTVHIDGMYENHFKEISEVHLRARLKDNPDISATIVFPIIDNWAIIKEQYETGIPQGLIRNQTNYDKVYSWLWYASPGLADALRTAGNTYYGLITDLLSHYISSYNVWTCGGYQIQVLYLLDSIRLQSDFAWILNGFDYGPIKQLQGLHQAAIIWPTDLTYLDQEFARILDPWPAQDPKGAEWTWEGWLATIGVSIPLGVGLSLELCTEPGSSDQYINGLYPIRGPAWHYPPQPYWSFNYTTPPHYTAILDCPVDLMITDSQGRRMGNVPGWDPSSGQSPFLTEIPGLGWYAILLPDGTRAWMINLPDDSMDWQITGTAAGNYTLSFMDSAGRFTNYLDAPINPGQTVQIHFDPTTDALPCLVYPDGGLVFSDNLLSFEPWIYNRSTGESSSILRITNTTNHPIRSPLRLFSESLDPNTITLMGTDGMVEGHSYLDLSSLLNGGTLNPGESVSRDLVFRNSKRSYFDWTVRLEGKTIDEKTIVSRTLFRQIGLQKCSREGLPPFDLAEGNAADWETWVQDMEPQNTYVFDDIHWKISGNASVICVTDAPFDMYIRYGKTLPEPWDLSQAKNLFISFFAANGNDFQNGSPWIRLKTDDGNYYEFQYYEDGYPFDLLNECLGQWNPQIIPLDAPDNEENGWRRTTVGNPDWTQIRYLEIHADTWGESFQLGVDGVGFDTDLPIYRDFNADCFVDTLDLGMLANYWLNQECTPTACEGADIDLSGKVDLVDFALFAEAWLKE